MSFTHLHVHSFYSILDGAASIKNLVKKAQDDGMTALALTDHGNMYGIKEFHDTATAAGIKPILGCEVYVAPDSRHNKKQARSEKAYEHLILLAKNKTGYHNLSKLVSLGFLEGFYYKPRIDKELLEKYHEGLIISSACLGGEIPQAIMHNEEERLHNAIRFFKGLVGDDFYLELQRHETNDPVRDAQIFNNQQLVNNRLVELSKEYGIKLIASNDVHFAYKEDAEAHDHLICLTTNANLDDPKRMRYTQQEYLKSPEEMATIFSDIPEAIANTQEIADKVELYELNHEPIMPIFPLPENFENDGDYLRHLVYEGAKEKYGTITDKLKERIDFELETIINMGFPGYFLIVWDFIKAAREMNVSVGPGRGSAAGSVISYCLDITRIDPMAYGLLFERFLNPERISLPDIDVDFDDDGRDEVLNWVARKYGKNHVAHIITFGTMAAKSAIKDVARVRNFPLKEAERLSKMVPSGPKVTFEKAYKESPELAEIRKKGSPDAIKVLEIAEKLEGSVRQKGIHACGVIIGRTDLMEAIPLIKDDNASLLVTQYEGPHAEAVGMLKMDFLGLKTLSIIKDTIKHVKQYQDIDIDIDHIPLDDKKTLELFSRGETIGVFQFESDGMRQNLKSLKPNRFEDLIAMNALYRPGPMEYIPSYINRKHGRESIQYDLPEMEEHLKETYGITVYQEQVMLLSQKLAGFTKGQADQLRKAMGKKKKALMEKLKVQFVDGAKQRGHDEKTIDKIWHDWEAFAQYAFNKSHSTCYAYVAFQTGYLKAHFPKEYMISILDRNLSVPDKLVAFMNETKRMGISILGPDINESFELFSINKTNEVRFGLTAIKGMGSNVVQSIINERNKNGEFKDIFNFVERIDTSIVNKRALEALAYSGGFDSFGIERHQYFCKDNSNKTFIESLLAYSNKLKSATNLSGNMLFDLEDTIQIDKPTPPTTCQEWTIPEKLNYERQSIGIYLSSHPLDNYQFFIDHFTNFKVANFDDLTDTVLVKRYMGKDLTTIAYVTKVQEAQTKTGNPYGRFTIEDKTGSYQMMLFSKDYVKFKNYLTKDYTLHITGELRKSYRDENLQEYRVKNIQLADEFINNIERTLLLRIHHDEITEDLLKTFSALKDMEKGNCSVKLKIVHENPNFSLNTISRTIRLKLTGQLMNFLTNNGFSIIPATDIKKSSYIRKLVII